MRMIDVDAMMDDINNSLNEMTNIGVCVDGDWLWAKLNDAIENAPTIDPQRKTGKWIDDGTYGDYQPHHAWHCSECEESVIEIGTPWFKFCPNCGADMRGEDDDIPMEYFESGGIYDKGR